MTAPPAQMPLPVFAEHVLGASHLSPASTVLDSALSWASMPPFTYPSAPRQQPKSKSPPANENHGLLFITGNTPAELRSKKNMTKVRKKAMGSYLEKGKSKSVVQEPRVRLHTEKSTDSSTSIASSSDQQHVHAINPNSDIVKIARRPLSPVHDQVPSPEWHLSTVRPSMDVILPSALMVIPSRTNVKLDFDEMAPRPFQSIGKPLDPFRSMFQAHHPRVSVEELKFHCSRVFGTRAMGQHWIPTLVRSPHAFLSTLCIASAHLDAINDRPIESVQTMALRQEVIHLIGQNLVSPDSRVDDYNVIALTQLICSEMIAGDETALHFHETGVEAMVKQRGGVSQLGVNGRLASTLSWVSLESAILREAKPAAIYTEFGASASSRTYPNTATIPESPLFCPRGDFETIKRSTRCSRRALELLRDIKTMMDISLDHDHDQADHDRQNAQSLKHLYNKITLGYPSAAELQQTNVLTPTDWTYEAIRIAATLQATSIIERAPLSSALNSAAHVQTQTQLHPSTCTDPSTGSLPAATLRHDSLVTSSSHIPCSNLNPFTFIPSRPTRPIFPPRAFPTPPAPTTLLLGTLRTAISNSDLSSCWADMAGVLFWISLTAAAASRLADKVARKWFAALAMRCSIMLCFEHPEPVMASLMRLSALVASSADGEGVKALSKGGKRRRRV